MDAWTDGRTDSIFEYDEFQSEDEIFVTRHFKVNGSKLETRNKP
jgi:hypothetical protein